MKLEDKIEWMRSWAERNGAELKLDTTCRMMWPCVGIVANTVFPDYKWHDEDHERIYENGEVWTPDDAYRKHPCVAVMGTGAESIEQLYKWICWFNDNGFVLEQEDLPASQFSVIELYFGKNKIARMVRGGSGK
jgi:hypothetical protein